MALVSATHQQQESIRRWCSPPLRPSVPTNMNQHENNNNNNKNSCRPCCCSQAYTAFTSFSKLVWKGKGSG
jgi:hypothetical protein